MFACEGGSETSPDDDAGTSGSTNAGTAGALSGSGGTSNAGSAGSNATSGTSNGGSAGSASGAAGKANAGSSGTEASGGDDGGASNAGAGSGGTSAGNANAGANSGGASGEAGASGGTAGTSGASGGAAGAPARPAVLVFSRTAGFRHSSIPAGITALQTLGEERDWTVTATEDPAVFSDAGLADYNVLVFLSTTGDILDADQQAAFERFIRAPHGFVGIHSASDTEYDWPFYGALVGAYFREHPSIQSATIVVENATHPATIALPDRWTRTDEWYAFQTNPRATVEVLLSLDETSYTPGNAHMDGDHPIAWYHEYEGARAFYTALGHTDESYAEPEFLGHVAGAIEWAAGTQ